MAVHNTIPSLIQESILEKLLVARYCIDFRKKFDQWNSEGCYGHPAALLLLSIIDTIGSYELYGSTRNHFNILSSKKYFKHPLSNKQIETIYCQYRNPSTHNSAIGLHVSMNIGTELNDEILVKENEKETLQLAPLFKITKNAVQIFLKDAENIIYQSKQLSDLINL